MAKSTSKTGRGKKSADANKRGARGAKTARVRAAVKPKPPGVDTYVGRFRIARTTAGRLTGSKVEAKISDERTLAPIDGPASLPSVSVFPLDDRALEMLEVLAVWRAQGSTLAAAEKIWRSSREPASE